MDPAWIDLAIVAACALLSALVTKMVMTGFRPNHLVFTLIWMFLFPVALVTAFLFVKPEIQIWRARAMAATYLEDEPLLSLFSARHSELEDGIRSTMTEAVKRGLHGDDARRMAFSQSVGFLMGHFENYLPRAGDGEVVAYAAQLLRIVRQVEAESGVRGYWLLTGSPAPDGSTFAGVAGVELSDLSRNMAGVVQSAVRRPREPMSRKEIDAYTAELERRFEARFAGDVSGQLEILKRPARNDTERERICRILIELYGEAFKLPPEHRAPAIRALMSRW